MTPDSAIYDVHHHFGMSPLEDPSTDLSTAEKTDRHVEMMDKSGITGAALLAPPIYVNPNGLADTRKINDELADAQARYPDRFPVLLGTIEPSYGPAGFQELDRILSDLAFDGVMWHSRFQKSPPNAPIMYDLIERTQSHDAVIHLHAFADSKLNAPWRVFDVIEDFPDITFVIHDIFSGSDQSDHVYTRAPELENAYFDTAAAQFLTRRIERFVTEVDADHLVFGTDYYTGFPVRSSWEITAIEAAAISRDAKNAILSENFKEIYRL